MAGVLAVCLLFFIVVAGLAGLILIAVIDEIDAQDAARRGGGFVE